MESSLKEKHNRMIREMVRAVAHLQALLADDDTPEHVKPALLACLELLDRGMLHQPMKDERVVIEVVAGIAYVASKTEFVQVIINDPDADTSWP